MRLMRSIPAGVLAGLTCLLWTAPSWAQGTSMFGNRGPMAQYPRSGTSGLRGGTGMSGGLSPTSGFGSGLGTGGMGGLGMGGYGQGMGGAGGTGFVGRTNTPNYFIGATPPGTQQSGTTGGGSNFRRGATGSTGSAIRPPQQNAQNAAGTAGPQRTPVRPRLEVAFESNPPKVDLAARRIAASVQKAIAQRHASGKVAVELEGGTAVLRGQVDRPQTGKLLETLVRLEPGVRDVRNELEVAAPVR